MKLSFSVVFSALLAGSAMASPHHRNFRRVDHIVRAAVSDSVEVEAELDISLDKRTDRAPRPEPLEPAHTIEINPHLAKRAAVTVSNIFVPIATARPPTVISGRTNLPRQPIGITDKDVPLQTNKFYTNFFCGRTDRPVYAMPYVVWWAKGVDEVGPTQWDPTIKPGYWGLGVAHTDNEQKVEDGWGREGAGSGYYYSPPWNRSLSFSATEFYESGKASLEVDTLRQFSVGLTIHEDKEESENNIRFIICQGMGMVSGTYTNLQPAFDSSNNITSVTLAPSPRAGIIKYKVVVHDGTADKLWVIYAKPDESVYQEPFELTHVNATRINASAKFTGLIQIAKISKTTANAATEAALDASAGAFCSGVTVSGSVAGTTGTYTFNFQRNEGATTNLLMYAYMHHVSSFTTATRNLIRAGVELSSNTKGMMKGVLANSWTLTETNLPVNLGWFPTPRVAGTPVTFTAAKMTQLVNILQKEVVEDMKNQTSVLEMYFNGKAYAKFAQICLVAKEVANNSTLARTCLTSLKKEWERYQKNTLQNKFIYDWAWRGIVPVSAYNLTDAYHDFGAGLYNDHHFQYSYFVYAGALIAYLDKALSGNNNFFNANKDFINSLARDYSNPSPADNYFPEFRNFNFFDGHSWASGIDEHQDGKNEESSSEDVFAHYALKMWAQVSNQPALEGLATLQLSILKRSLNEYMLFTPGVNTAHPDNFLKNRVAGILFENKVAHETWFGTELKKIQGIHMIPFNPASTFIKSAAWAQSEWDLYFNGRTGHINDGWKGILFNNKCLWDPASTWAFFVQGGYRKEWTDQGASRSWYLAVAGLMGGAST